MMRTVHRLEHVLLIVHFHRVVLRVLIVGVVAGSFVKLNIGDVRGDHLFVASFFLLIPQELFQGAPQNRSVRQPPAGRYPPFYQSYRSRAPCPVSCDHAFWLPPPDADTPPASSALES